VANKINKMSKLVKASQSINKAIESLSLADDHDLVTQLQTINSKIRTDISSIIDSKLTTNKEVKSQ
jgi:hypothetical protein